MILDRNGAVLADSRPTFVVLFTPLDLKKKNYGEISERLSKILNLSQEEISRRLQPAIKHSSLIRLMDRASHSIAFALAEQRPNLPGVSVVTEMVRRYPHGTLASHVNGYLGQISSQEFTELKEEGYHANWMIGKMGLEKMYDRVLRGEHGGMQIEVDASGHSLKILNRKEPVSGYQLKTTLNLKIQEAAEKALGETQKAGAVVALDPRSGEILAYASAPPFDPNWFLYTRGEALENQTDPTELLNRGDLPLFNRPIQGTYPPGSIFKIITTAAALESKKISLTAAEQCPGYFWIGDGANSKKILCWKHKGHGSMTLEEALINSCNVFYIHLGLKTGPDALEAMAKKFGLGKPTGAAFPGEKSGIIPGRSMFKTSKRRWFDGDTANMAIGQGTVLFTPMQAAEMISIVANRGTRYRPYIVDEIRTPTGELYDRNEPKIEDRVHLSPSTWEFLDNALVQVVERGTGQTCKIPNVKVGGKTGTAQNPHGKDHAWFVCYAPVGRPVIALAVMVEHGLHGSVGAAPIARQILLAALTEAGILSEQERAQIQTPPEVSGD